MNIKARTIAVLRGGRWQRAKLKFEEARACALHNGTPVWIGTQTGRLTSRVANIQEVNPCGEVPLPVR